jgi:hypothetical protein
MGKLVAVLFFVLNSANAFAVDHTADVLTAANDSAAAFLIDGKIDAKLARAFDMLGASNATNEEKALSILEANRSEND